MDSKVEMLDQVAPLLPKLKSKCILVTGASGLVGASLVRFLMRLNEASDCAMHVVAVARNVNRMHSLFGDYLDDPLLDICPYDAEKPFDSEESIDYIVHAASPSDPRSFSTAPADVLLANVLGTRTMLELAREHGAKLLFVSTGEIYGPNPDDLNMLSETYYGNVNPLDARSCYPEGKRATETLCASYGAQYGVSFVIARLCYVFGELITEQNSRADAQFLRNARQGKDIILKSAGTQRRTYCYADDAAAALLFILIEGIEGAAYNVANRDMVITIRDYAQALADAAGVSVCVEEPSAEEKAGFSKSPNSVLDPSRLEALGWKPRFTLADAVGRLLSA